MSWKLKEKEIPVICSPLSMSVVKEYAVNNKIKQYFKREYVVGVGYPDITFMFDPQLIA